MASRFPASALPHLDRRLMTVLSAAAADTTPRLHCLQMDTPAAVPLFLVVNRAYARSFEWFVEGSNTAEDAGDEPPDQDAAGSDADEPDVDASSSSTSTSTSTGDPSRSAEVPKALIFSALVSGDEFLNAFGPQNFVNGLMLIDGKKTQPVIIDTLTRVLMASSLTIGYHFLYYAGDEHIDAGIVGLAVHEIDRDLDAKTHSCSMDVERVARRMEKFRELSRKLIDEMQKPAEKDSVAREAAGGDVPELDADASESAIIGSDNEDARNLE